MNRDLIASGFLLVGVGIYAIYLYSRKRIAMLPEASQGLKGASTTVPGVKLPGPVNQPVIQSPLDRLLAFAQQMGLTVTSTTGGEHVPGSLHYRGRAIDVGARGLTQKAIDAIRAAAEQLGFRVLQETYTGRGRYGYSSGPHLHIEVPQ